jgi:probable rRNA maturation factor
MAARSQRSAGTSRRRTLQPLQPAPSAVAELTLRNRQRLRRLNLPLLRRILQAALRETYSGGGYDLSFYVVSAAEIARLNESFLQPQGATDVITFDYGESQRPATRSHATRHTQHPSGSPCPVTGAEANRHSSPASLHGEIFVCLEQAVSQAREFRTTWQSELVRYCVHGLLHLLGYDDHNALDRRQMKVAENHLVRQLARTFAFQQLASKS